MKKKVLILIGIVLLMMPFVLSQPTQQFNKIYMNPFYRSSTLLNTNYTSQVIVNPPDKVSAITSAIITYQIYLSSVTANFSVWVNGKYCNNPNFYISGTYGQAGEGMLYFDCSNVITQAGNYNITLRSTTTVGASTGWLDVTYMNNPQGDLTLHGTEYQIGQDAKVWLQLLNNAGASVENGVCFVGIHAPVGGMYVEDAQMTNMIHDGLYFYDFPVPDIEGVYPAIAECYYIATLTQYYATNYWTTLGVYSSGTIANTQVADSSNLRMQEGTYSGVRRIDVGFNVTNVSSCLTIPESLLTGVSVSFTSIFNSVINDDLTIWLYNFTGSNWVALPNKIPSQSGISTVSNTISLSNLTKSGFYDSTKGVLVKVNDTTLPDTSNTNWDIDQIYFGCNQLSNQTWQQVKGSSEIHVNPQISGGNSWSNDFFLFTLCGNEGLQSLSSACEQFQFGNHTGFYEDFSEPQGWLYEEITVINARQRAFTSSFEYETPMGVDCTSFLDITMTDEDNVTTDYWDSISYRAGNKDDNCIVTFPITMTASQTRFQVRLYMDNYMLWEVNRDKRFIDVYRLEPETFCTAFAQGTGIEMVVPIHTNLSEYGNNKFLTGCWQILDDLYWWDYFMGTVPDRTTSGEFESVLSEIRFYYPELIQAFDTVINIKSGQVPLFETWTSCEKESGIDSNIDDFTCQLIKSPDSYFGSEEGWILANLTFVNMYRTTIPTKYEFETGRDVACSAVLEILRVDANGTISDIANQSVLRGGTQGNCLITLPVNLMAEIDSFDILIKQQNYISRNILKMMDKVQSTRTNTEVMCQLALATYNVSYYLPINSSLEAYPDVIRFCWRALDDLYWWDYFNAKYVADKHYLYEILNYYGEFEYFYPFIMQAGDIVATYQRTEVQTQTLALAQNMPSNIWNYTNRSVDTSQLWVGGTEYSTNEQVGRIVTRILDGGNNPVNGAICNLTIYLPTGISVYQTDVMSIPPSQVNGVYYYDFNHSGQVGVHTYTIDCNKAGQRYFLMGTYHIFDNNVSLISDAIWSYSTRNLTYYPTQTDLTDYDKIQTYVWNSTSRTLTSFGFINNTAIAESVWSWNGLIYGGIIDQILAPLNISLDELKYPKVNIG